MTNKTMWMKVSAMLLAFLLVLPAGVLAVPEVEVPENVITNGTFADENGDGVADGWTYSSSYIKVVKGAEDALIPAHLEKPLPGYKGNYLQFDGTSGTASQYTGISYWKKGVKADTVYRGTVYYKGNSGACEVNITPIYWYTGSDGKTYSPTVVDYITEYNVNNPANPLPAYDATMFKMEGKSFKVSSAQTFSPTSMIKGLGEDGWARAEFVFRFNDFRQGREELADGQVGFQMNVSVKNSDKTTFADFSLVESDNFMLNGDFKDGSHFWILSSNCDQYPKGTVRGDCHTIEDGVFTMKYSSTNTMDHKTTVSVLPSTIYRLTYEATSNDIEDDNEKVWPWVSISGTAGERTANNNARNTFKAYQNPNPVDESFDTYEFYFQTAETENQITLNFYPGNVIPTYNETRKYGLDDTMSIKNISLRMVTKSELSLVDGVTRTELTSFSPENPVRVRGAYLTTADANVQPVAAVYKETEGGAMQLVSLQFGEAKTPQTRVKDYRNNATNYFMDMIRIDEPFDFSGADLPALEEGEKYTIQAFVFDSATGIKALTKSAYVK